LRFDAAVVDDVFAVNVVVFDDVVVVGDDVAVVAVVVVVDIHMRLHPVEESEAAVIRRGQQRNRISLVNGPARISYSAGLGAWGVGS
jgi:hypothetical protein